jgi:hypothetical protein
MTFKFATKEKNGQTCKTFLAYSAQGEAKKCWFDWAVFALPLQTKDPSKLQNKLQLAQLEKVLAEFETYLLSML